MSEPMSRNNQFSERTCIQRDLDPRINAPLAPGMCFLVSYEVLYEVYRFPFGVPSRINLSNVDINKQSREHAEELL